ncbi:MAG: family 20 glycosylhydrolase [Planctomycetota bacterium]|nr:family 20 glycosylhydrolase [Planctomycetota bacterium]
MRILSCLGFLIAFCLIQSGTVSAQNGAMASVAANRPALIPKPRQLKWDSGSFPLARIHVVDVASVSPSLERQIRDFVNENGGEVGTWTSGGTAEPSAREPQIFLQVGGLEASSSIEAYSIGIDEAQVRVTSNSEVGLFRALATLRQLAARSGALPACKIVDWPAFEVRGFMHDVGRNFQSVGLLERWIDVMAFYKLNVLHFHLTEYPGWRLESALHPEVTSAASMWPTRKPGQHYTYAELKGLIGYARDRHVRLVPEFDLPGHSEALRKATGLTMGDEGMIDVLEDLLGEFCDQIPSSDVPVIHIGTDEVRRAEERPHPDLVRRVTEYLQGRNREVTVWHPGIAPTNDQVITQLWAKGSPTGTHRYLDSRGNYVNHMDPFTGTLRAFFQQPCRVPVGSALALGGILCLWNDNRIVNEFDLYRYNPALPAAIAYAERIWRGSSEDLPAYWAKMPSPEDAAFEDFREFEGRLIDHRDRWQANWPFPYVSQSELVWRLTNPLEESLTTGTEPPAADALEWRDEVARGGTLHLNHFFGFEGHLPVVKSGVAYARTFVHAPREMTAHFWVDFMGFSRSGGRRGGPSPDHGEWSKAGARLWIAGTELAPPLWVNPALGKDTAEIPFEDELFYLRDPLPVLLHEGWNELLVEIPKGSTTRKWLFTCVPVEWDGARASEASELRYAADLPE